MIRVSFKHSSNYFTAINHSKQFETDPNILWKFQNIRLKHQFTFLLIHKWHKTRTREKIKSRKLLFKTELLILLRNTVGGRRKVKFCQSAMLTQKKARILLTLMSSSCGKLSRIKTSVIYCCLHTPYRFSKIMGQSQFIWAEFKIFLGIFSMAIFLLLFQNTIEIDFKIKSLAKN